MIASAVGDRQMFPMQTKQSRIMRSMLAQAGDTAKRGDSATGKTRVRLGLVKAINDGAGSDLGASSGNEHRRSGAGALDRQSSTSHP
jgi:hypothetical protein